MTKKQKLWLAVFLAMFLIPEILWNAFILLIFYWILNATTGISLDQIYSIHLLPTLKSQELANLFAFIELIGFALSYFSIILFGLPKNNIAKNLIIFIGGILLLLIAYVSIGLMTMNPQIG